MGGLTEDPIVHLQGSPRTLRSIDLELSNRKGFGQVGKHKGRSRLMING